jgi:hypothetical protein
MLSEFDGFRLSGFLSTRRRRGAYQVSCPLIICQDPTIRFPAFLLWHRIPGLIRFPVVIGSSSVTPIFLAGFQAGR